MLVRPLGFRGVTIWQFYGVKLQLLFCNGHCTLGWSNPNDFRKKSLALAIADFVPALCRLPLIRNMVYSVGSLDMGISWLAQNEVGSVVKSP